MKKINVNLKAFYGCGCSGSGYNSDNSMEFEVSEKELDALKKFDTNNITRKEIVEAIDNGVDVLQSLHEKIDEACYHMEVEYWLYEAYNDCLEESLTNALENDMEEGVYVPSMTLEDFVDGAKNGEIDFEDLQFGCYDDLDEDFDYEEEEYLESIYESYILNEYYDWVCEHDHEFVAERVGLDLDACRDEDTKNYIIEL